MLFRNLFIKESSCVKTSNYNFTANNFSRGIDTGVKPRISPQKRTWVTNMNKKNELLNLHMFLTFPDFNQSGGVPSEHEINPKVSENGE